MMKIKATIDLGDFGARHDEGVDSAIARELVAELVSRIEPKVQERLEKFVIKSAEKIISAKVEYLINTVLEKPITIPIGWQKTEEYESILDMAETRLSRLYEGKLNINGSCTKDPLLANIEKHMENLIAQMKRDLDNKANKLVQIAVRNNKTISSLEKLLSEKAKA